MKKAITIVLSLAAASAMASDTLRVETFRYAGAYKVQQPVMLDSTDVNAKKYDAKSLLESDVRLDLVKEGQTWSGVELPGADQTSLHLLGFQVNVTDYFKGQLIMPKAPKEYKLYMDGKSSGTGEVTLLPGSHQFVIKYLSQPENKDSLQLSFSSDSAAHTSALTLKIGDISEQRQLMDIHTLQRARGYSALDLSADGQWMITCTSIAREDWWDYDYFLWNRNTGKKVKLTQNSHWLPKSNRFYQIRHIDDQKVMVVIDPATLAEEVWVENLPSDWFEVFPTEDRLLYTKTQNGPTDLQPDAFQFLHPDDRQPGWRDRSYLCLYDIKTGLSQQLTYGYNNTWSADISRDGQKVLIGKSEARLTARPTTLNSIYLLDLGTMQMDTLVDRDGFIESARFSPDGNRVLLYGSPEALTNIGNVTPEGMTASMTDHQLYVMDLKTKEVKPLTREFNPSVERYFWSTVDNNIYLTAENRDSVSFYRMDPNTGKVQMLDQPEEVIGRFAWATDAPVIAFAGQSNDHSSRLYSMEVGKKVKPARLHEDLNAAVYGDVEVNSATAWTCRNSIGDNVSCRYYLPNGFDSNARYPMIVYYYGGCSPTTRSFEFPYPWHIWAAQGYVVLVVNPSGATGFGQEWSARHVNTAGVDPARDIIEATRTFCDEHPFVNREKLGCIGASYGGFMTQYLQTVTDIFRCAVSHAGISDHTTYWGLGYWGYTYSEVSMANTYPWTRKDLYVERSPIYNVDKIQSSILFLHGTEDTNVPYNNSVQMYTALKLLGKDVEMISIKGENHGIRKPSRRRLWHNATMAWFARCLKDDPTWWNELYPNRTM